MIPGEMWCPEGDIEINAGRKLATLRVANTGDRPIQVGSHYHFFETNDALQFDRKAAYGFRLNIPSGTAVRFEPGQSREVEIVALAGARRVFGFAGRVMGPLRAGGPAAAGAGADAGAAKKATARKATAKKATVTKPAAKKPAVRTSAPRSASGSKR